MLLKDRASGDSVEILDLVQLFSLFENEVLGRHQIADNKDASKK